jgi:uncharacterized protein
VEFDSTRRKFLQAGLVLPAAGFVASRFPAEASQTSSGVSVKGVKGGRIVPQKGLTITPGVVYRTLGKTGLKVSGVGCGIGLDPDPAVLNRAVDLGVNYFDTGRMYSNGKSEEAAGEAFKGKRNKIILATKTDARTKADVFKDIDASLKALQTDHLDIWHLHGRDTPGTITDELVDACVTVKKQGKTRFIGVSSHDINAVVDKIVKYNKFDVVQTTYSYPIGSPMRNASITKLQNAGIGVVAMKVILAVAGFIPPKEFRLKNEGPLAAVKWVLLNPAIATTVPFAKNITELEMNFRAMAEPYTPEDEKMLYACNEGIRPLYCRMCYECKGQCPKGVPVTDELRFLAYNDFGGNFHQARMNFISLPKEIRDVKCNDCGSCSIQCPNGVEIRNRLIRAQTLLA